MTCPQTPPFKIVTAKSKTMPFYMYLISCFYMITYLIEPNSKTKMTYPQTPTFKTVIAKSKTVTFLLKNTTCRKLRFLIVCIATAHDPHLQNTQWMFQILTLFFCFFLLLLKLRFVVVSGLNIKHSLEHYL